MTAAPIEGGAMLVRDGRIVAIGSAGQLCDVAPDAEVIDFGAAIIMPPLVNAHTHLELTDFPEWFQHRNSGASTCDSDQGRDGFVDWILELIRIKHSLEPDDLQASIQHGIKTLLQSGTGAVCDILSVHLLDATFRETPLYGWLCFELIGLDEGMGAVLPMMANDWLQGGDLHRLQRGLSPHSPYTVGPQTLGKVSELARKHNRLTTIHVAESEDEATFLLESAGPIAAHLYPAVGWHKPMPPYQRGSLEYLEKSEVLSPPALLVHGVQFDDAAIRALARAGASVVLCPRSNARLGVGRAPVESYLCQGVNLALGTDSMASNASLSLWDEMEYARDVYGPAIDPLQLLIMATVNGARALRIDDRIGTLTEGKEASFLVLQPAELPPIEQLPDFLCRGERGGEVTRLYLDNIDVLGEGNL